MVNDAWMNLAACKDHPLGQDAWFPGPGRQPKDTQEALRICREDCPVQDLCLDFAIETSQQHGVWGGLTESAVKNERRRRARAKGIEHGTVGGYTNHGCRCRPCFTAHSHYQKKRYQERQEASGGQS